MFRVGQKVVCVREPKCEPYWPWREFPKEGAVYTVRGYKEADSIWLSELSNEVGPSGKEAGFGIDRFRPVIERKTDISIFTAMLNPSKRRVAA